MMLFRNEDMSAYVKKVHFKLHDRNKYHDIIDSFLDAEHYDTDLLSHSIRSSFLMSGRHSSNMLYRHYDIFISISSYSNPNRIVTKPPYEVISP